METAGDVGKNRKGILTQNSKSCPKKQVFHVVYLRRIECSKIFFDTFNFFLFFYYLISLLIIDYCYIYLNNYL
jgi:hypothetical protein